MNQIPKIGATLEITAPRQLDFEPGRLFSIRNNDVTIKVKLIEQRQVGDGWVLTGEVTDVWQANSQN